MFGSWSLSGSRSTSWSECGAGYMSVCDSGIENASWSESGKNIYAIPSRN